MSRCIHFYGADEKRFPSYNLDSLVVDDFHMRSVRRLYRYVRTRGMTRFDARTAVVRLVGVPAEFKPQVQS